MSHDNFHPPHHHHNSYRMVGFHFRICMGGFAMTDAFKELASTVEKIGTLLRSADQAHDLPRIKKWLVSKIAIYQERNSYTVESAEADKVAQEIKKRTEAEMFAAGEAERDSRLEEISIQIETLRVILPVLAANACLHLGTVARDKFPKSEKQS